MRSELSSGASARFPLSLKHLVPRFLPRHPARMARDKKHKPKGAGASSELRSRSAVLRHAPLVLVAVLLQLLLTWGYFHLQSAGAGSSDAADLEPPPSQAAGAYKMAKPAAPANCPSEWTGCPQVSGADWVTLAELEAAAEASPSPSRSPSPSPSSSPSPNPGHSPNSDADPGPNSLQAGEPEGEGGAEAAYQP